VGAPGHAVTGGIPAALTRVAYPTDELLPGLEVQQLSRDLHALSEYFGSEEGLWREFEALHTDALPGYLIEVDRMSDELFKRVFANPE
jgi:hypothetical protein